MNKKIWITCFTAIFVTTVKFSATAPVRQQSSDTNRWSKPARATSRQGSKINNLQGVHDDTNRAKGSIQLKYSQTLHQRDPSSATVTTSTGPSLQQDLNENIFQTTKAPLTTSTGPSLQQDLNENIFQTTKAPLRTLQRTVDTSVKSTVTFPCVRHRKRVRVSLEVPLSSTKTTTTTTINPYPCKPCW